MGKPVYTEATKKKNEKYRSQYAKENYDRITIFRTKGEREKIKDIANQRGVSVNELINSLLNDWFQKNGISL